MSQYKILIVDNSDNVKSIEDCLKDQSCTMISASTGRSALKILRSADIDILISRLELLDLNGIALYNAMKDQHPDMHGILLADSTCKMDSNERDQLKVIDRPFDMNTLSDCVKQTISQIKQKQRFQKRILIVEDTKSLLMTQLKMLKIIGFTDIITANNGNHAIEIIEEMTSPPDLIISDFYMPEKTGLELLQWLKNHASFKNIPFIIATSKKEAMMALAAGADHFIIKPYDFKTIQEAIDNVF